MKLIARMYIDVTTKKSAAWINEYLYWVSNKRQPVPKVGTKSHFV